MPSLAILLIPGNQITGSLLRVPNQQRSSFSTIHWNRVYLKREESLPTGMSSIQGFGIQELPPCHPILCKNRFQANTISLLEAKAGAKPIDSPVC